MAAILEVKNVSKYIGDLILFQDVSFELEAGEKTALIGINGAGKTSLLNIITGHDSPDEGEIRIAAEIKTAYLEQQPSLPEESTVMDSLFRSENVAVTLIRSYEEALLSGNLAAIEKTGNEMDRLKLWDYENRIKQLLTQLDIKDYDQKIGELSGGQRKRVALANVLINEPDLLILDEPTNHLDLDLIEWLETYIRRSSVSLIMVTHDRFFLDRICTTIFEIDRMTLFRYPGNYSRFVELREKRLDLEQQEIDKARNLLRKEEEWMRRMPKARGTKSKYRINMYYRLKDISSAARKEKNIRINIAESRLGSKILVAKKVNFAWDNTFYLKDFSYIFSRFEKIGIIGKNGTGKSTFLDILTQNLKPGSGIIEIGETIQFGYYRQEGLSFDEKMRVLDAITEIAETVVVGNGTTITASQFLTWFLFPHQKQNDFIYKLSGGEKRRLYLCSVLMQNPNFLILDEPTNDLDISSLQVLEEYLSAFMGCVLVVSHDRYFMDSVVDHLFVFEEEGCIKDFPGNYSAYFEWKQRSVKKDEPVINKNKTTEKSRPGKKTNKLSFKEKRELEQLENEIAALEKEKSILEEELNSGKLELRDLREKSTRIALLIKELDKKSDRWFELSEKG